MNEKDEISELREAIKSLTDKLNAKDQHPPDDLGGDTIPDEPEPRNQMFTIDPEAADEFGDRVELVTKARLKNTEEARKLAFSFMVREYHNMMGSKFGAHSKLIPVEHVETGLVNLSWYSGLPVQKIIHNGHEYYKIRMLISDIFIKKYLQLTIPTEGGKARHESILDKGITVMGVDQNSLPIPPLYASRYKTKSTTEEAGDMMFKEGE